MLRLLKTNRLGCRMDNRNGVYWSSSKGLRSDSLSATNGTGGGNLVVEFLDGGSEDLAVDGLSLLRGSASWGDSGVLLGDSNRVVEISLHVVSHFVVQVSVESLDSSCFPEPLDVGFGDS